MRRWIVIGAMLLAGCGDPAGGNLLPMVAYSEVPIVVRDAVKAQRPDVKFRTAFRLPSGGFQMRGKDPRGKSVAIDVTPDGVVQKIIG